VPLAVGFALVAAFLFAGSASLQQRAARDAVAARLQPGPGRAMKAVRALNPGRELEQEPDHPAIRLEHQRLEPQPEARPRRTAIFLSLWRLLRQLIRRPLWLLGWLTNLFGFGVQALALHFGSVALVQPVLVTQLLFALPMAAAWQRRRPGRREWTAGAFICGGLIVFLAVRGVAPVADLANRSRLALASLATAAAVATLLLVCVGLSRLFRATLLAVAAGLCFAVSAAMIKLTSEDLLQRGVGATARDWPGYALAAATLAGLLVEQGAFAAGSLPTAIAAMSITNPVASYLIGVFAFGVAPPQGAGSLIGLAGAGVLISIGAIGLAHSPLVQSDVPPSGLVGERRVYA
jgi:drug/metabolite transporter (DMT)-like permease